MSKLVTIFGGSGFVGRYIARRMAKEGWRVRVAVRNPNQALFVKPYGVVGQVEPIFANIRDDDSVRNAIHSADAVVNCVGTFDATGRNNFQAVQNEGAARIARIAAEEGAQTLVHISAIGADVDGASQYAVSKGQGEAAILAAFPSAMILRPSIVFGPEDAFFNRFAAMTRLGPVLPIAGAETRFQPVYVDNVAAAAQKGVLGQASGIFELGGPDVENFRQLMQRMLGVIRRRRLIFAMPFFVAGLMAFAFDMLQAGTFGLFKNGLLTRDQVRSLKADNVVQDGARTLADLGVEATSMEAVLDEYLWPFRSSGQYAEIKESARNLRQP